MIHFRRERFVPMGGPDGGSGGRGGNIYLLAKEGMSTLLDFRYNRHHKASPGGRGGTNNRAGRTGKDKVLHVPCGTVAYDLDTGECIGEVLREGDSCIVAEGGKGGIGNSAFATSRNQAPTKTIPPEIGQKRRIRLELKLIADVGIIGAPNAGKSTLITVISAAKPKVADYPFTTLTPNLGVVSYKYNKPFVVADVPGLIPGASQGKGLGHDFLRHIERTRILVHLIDGSQETSEAMIQDFEDILKELELYDSNLMKRPRLTVISKLDAIVEPIQAEGEEEFSYDSEALQEFRQHLKEKDVSWIELSSAHRRGIDGLLEWLSSTLEKYKFEEPEPSTQEEKPKKRDPRNQPHIKVQAISPEDEGSSEERNDD